MAGMRRLWLPLGGVLAVYAVLALPGAGERGIVAEEVQPYLARHPRVLEARGDAVVAAPPHEADAPAGPRWVATPYWPVLAYDGASRQWPVLIRGHQTALASYVGLALGPALGGGIAGIRRTSVLLGAVLIGFVWLAARRLDIARPWLAAAIAGICYGFVFFSRTGYAFELVSRLMMMAAVVAAAPARPPGRGRATLIGALGGLAILSRATVAVTLVPALVILLADPRRRPGRAAAALAAAALVALPAAVYGALHAIGAVADTSLAGVSVASLWERAADMPGQLALQLSWVGDPLGVLSALSLGDASIGPTAFAALIGTVPFVAAIARWWHGCAGDAERMFACAAVANAIGSAWLYGRTDQFQLALALEPLFALAVAEQIGALRTRAWIGIGAGAALLLRAQGIAHGLWLEPRIANPMLSGATQRGAVAALRDAGERGDGVVTTMYEHAGVIEAWTGGAIRPWHAWPMFRGNRDPATLAHAWRALLADRTPRYVLVSRGSNPVAGAGSDGRAIEQGLVRAAAAAGFDIDDVRASPTEGGAPGWALLRLRARR
jgi:hypothetical protein